MFELRQLAIASMVAISVSTGCCLTKPNGIPGTGHNGACGIAGTSCCDAGPAVSCGDGGCAGGCAHGIAQPGSLLGLRHIGKLFHMSSYGLGCGSGCGEVYWHDWISDPPRPDPCDTCGGNWTGVVATSSDDGWEDPRVFSQPMQPAYDGPAFREPGNRLSSGLMGVSSWAHRLKHGLLPKYGGCATCATGSNGSTFIVGSGVPLDVTTQHVLPADRRPPHPVVAAWQR